MALWPFGRKKKKNKLASEKLQDKQDDSSTTTARANIAAVNSTDDRDYTTSSQEHYATQNNIAELESAFDQENIPLQQPPGYQNEDEDDDDDDDVDFATRQTTNTGYESLAHSHQPSISSFQHREPLVEIDNLAGARETVYGQPQITSFTSLQPEHSLTTQPLYGVPTLRSKRSSTIGETPRAKSLRTKSANKAREREVKALASPIPTPKRPASFSSGLLARDTKKVAGGLDKRLHRPTSEVSLPMADSLRTSFSGESGPQNSYRVTAFDALSPRPTIKYGENPRLFGRGSSRSSARKGKGQTIPEEPSLPTPPLPHNARARMNDLADNLDARAIRELMDRDTRRRDRKKSLDAEKLARKLQRKAEQQRAEEVRMANQAAQAVIMQAVSLAASPMELAFKNRSQPISTEAQADPYISSSRRDTETSVPWDQDTMDDDGPDLFGDPRLSSEQVSIRDDAIIESATAIRLSTISMSPPASPSLTRERTMSPSNLSSVAMAPRDSVEPESSVTTSGYLHPDIRRERDVEPSAKQGSSWTSIFKRSGTKRKVSTEKDKDQSAASEFSNVSRESFLRKNQPLTIPVVQRSFKRAESAPHRKQSKFREDLPELPISPPRSRIQSPDLDLPLSPYVDDTRKLDDVSNNTGDTPIEDVHPALRDQYTRSRGQSLQGTISPEPVLLSQSLASIDSEASWLSGRPQKRGSLPIGSVRESQVSLVQALEEQPEPDFSRRDFSDNTIRGPGELSAQLRDLQSASGDSEDSLKQEPQAQFAEAVKYNIVKGRRPNIIQRGPMARSREGLLDEYLPGDEESPVSPLSPSAENLPLADSASIHRATSINLGQKVTHARQLSAGSARLLDIPARSSSEAKRVSTISTGSSVRSPLVSPRESRHVAPESQEESDDDTIPEQFPQPPSSRNSQQTSQRNSQRSSHRSSQQSQTRHLP